MNARVAIGIPTAGDIWAPTVEWLLATVAELAAVVLIEATKYGIQHNRNAITKRFLETDCSHLFWLDSDCLPQRGTVQRLLSYGLPFVCAPGAQVVGHEVGPMAVDWDEKRGGYVQHRPMVGLQQVDATGCAGMLIERSVLERMGRPWWEFLYNGDGMLMRGEDFYFCEKLAEMGIARYADFDLVQRHRVQVVV